MINTDDLDPPRPTMSPKDLQTMSVGELKDYIETLEAEIDRAKTMIESKESLKSGAENLFKF